MIRPIAIVWGGVMAAVCTVLFQTSYEVGALRETLARINEDIAREHETIRVLNGDWAFLNQPDRLRELANSYTDLVPLTAAQIVAGVDSLPLRPPPEPLDPLDPPNADGEALPDARPMLLSGTIAAPLPRQKPAKPPRPASPTVAAERAPAPRPVPAAARPASASAPATISVAAPAPAGRTGAELTDAQSAEAELVDLLLSSFRQRQSERSAQP
ncbi:MAG: cell division protein FtsL [Inquilinaceae bacterium]